MPTADERIREYKLGKLVKDARRRARKDGLLDADGNPFLRLADGTPIILGEDGKPVGLMQLLEAGKVDWTGEKEADAKEAKEKKQKLLSDVD